MTVKLLIATTNPGKVREITRLIDDLPVECVHLGDPELPEMPESPEDRDTFEENAVLKARHYGHISGLPTISEDAGLTIPVLDGWPGVRSARVAETDAERVALALEKMKEYMGEDRSAAFVSVAAYFDPSDGTIKFFYGICQGTLLESPRGENGFGYDPIFLHPGYGKTLAEITTEEKNLVSHRGQSFTMLAKWLSELYEMHGG